MNFFSVVFIRWLEKILVKMYNDDDDDAVALFESKR